MNLSALLGLLEMFKGKRVQRSNNSSSKSNSDVEPSDDPNHWSLNVQEASVSFDSDADLLLIGGGAEHGELCWIASLPSKGQNMIHHGGARFNIGDIFVEVENQSVVGFTSYDLASWLSITSKNGNIISIRFVNHAYLTRDLRKYLNTRFRKHSLDHDLQHTIRLNVYRRTVPCTTRQMREGEIDGVDYRFLTTDQFQLLEESGGLLESGTYSGNFYGTPLPPRQDEVNLSDPPSPQRSSPRSDLHLGRNGEAESGMANLKLLSGPVTSPNGDEDDDDNALPPGWEKVDIYPECGIFYVDHINKKTQFERPQVKKPAQKIWSVDDLRGEFITTCLVKGPKGLGFTIIGGDETNNLLQVKTIIHGGPAYLDQKLQKGDVLLSVNNKEVLGSSHKEIIRLFQAIPVGTPVPITVCRGYPMSFDPNDPTHKVITTIAVQPPDQKMDLVQNHLPSGTRRVVPGLSPSKRFVDFSGNEETPSLDGSQASANSLEFRRPSPNLDVALNGIESKKINLVRGLDGFRFTLSDLPGGRGPLAGQRVRSILDRSRCGDLKEGDVIEKINDITVSRMTHLQVVEILKACPVGKETEFVVIRGVPVPSRSSSVTPSLERSPQIVLESNGRITKPSWTNKGYPASSQGVMPNQSQEVYQGAGRSKTPGPVLVRTTNASEEPAEFANDRQHVRYNFTSEDNFHAKSRSSGHPFSHDVVRKGTSITPDFIPAYHFNDQKFSEGANGFASTSSSSRFLGHQPMAGLAHSSSASATPVQIDRFEPGNMGEHHTFPVRIFRHAEGFGFKLAGGIEEGSPLITIGNIIAEGAADSDGRLKVGDEVLSIDSISTAGISCREAKDLLTRASVRGVVDLELRRWIGDGPSPDFGRTVPNPSPLSSSSASDAHQRNRHQRPEIVLSRYSGLSQSCREVRLVKLDQQNFGFTIISTLAKSGSQICSIVEDGPAAKSGQLNVDDLLVAINGVDVRSLTHEDIVALIRSSGNQVDLLVDTPPLSDRLSSLVVADSSEKQNPYQIQRLPYHMRDSEQGFGRHPSEENDRMEQDFLSWESKDHVTSPDVHHSKIPASKFHYVEIKKSSKGFGFTISGGREYGDVPLSILKIAEGSPACQDGNLKVGDQIVEINGQNASGMTHPEAIKAVQSNPLKVALLVKRQT